MRQRYIFRLGVGLIPVDMNYEPQPRIHVIGDSISPVRNMADGRMYDSKSAIRRSYRENGVREVGNDFSGFTPRAIDPPSVADTMSEVYEHLRNGGEPDLRGFIEDDIA